MNRKISTHRLMVVIAGLVLLSTHAGGQDTALAGTDSRSQETLEIDLARISIESRNLIFSLKNDMRDFISDSELESLRENTDARISTVDSILLAKKESYLEVRNVRSIKNLINYWKQQLDKVQAVDGKISAVNADLDKKRFKYARELDSWKMVKMTAKDYKLDPVVMGRIDQGISLLDTALDILARKSDQAVGLLDITSAAKIRINDRINRYETILFKKQEDIFKSGQPGIFSIAFTPEEKKEMRQSFLELHKGEFRNLGAYFRSHSNRILWHLALLALMVFIFIQLRRYRIPERDDEDLIYRRSLKIIVSNPVNSALIIVLFASVVIYPNKPLLLIDLFKLLVSIPIAITLINMSHRKYLTTIIAFELLIIIQIINTNLPSHLPTARYLLLFTGLLEIHTLASFIRKIRKSEWNNPMLYNLVMVMAYLNILLAVAGIIANVVGKVLLAQSLLSAVTGTALAVVLISLAMMVGNGLFMLFIDSRFSNFIHVIRKRKKVVKEKITRAFQFLAAIFLIYYILEAFGFDVIVVNAIRDFFLKDRTLGTVSFTWGDIFIFFLVIWLSIEVSKIIRLILEEDILDRLGLSQGLPNTIALLVRYTIVTLGVIAAASAAGLPLSKLTIILGAFSVGIGFGLQNIFNNLVSGLILLLERPIKIGDTIEVGELVGVVKSIGIRASNVHTLDGAEIIVPNGNLISNEVINWTLTDKRRRVEVLVGVSYGSDPYQVYKIFMDILTTHPDVVRDPAPNVLFNNFGESSLDFRLLFWTDNFDEWIRIRSEIIFKIFDALKQAGIEIPFPQRDLHIRSGSVEIPQREAGG